MENFSNRMYEWTQGRMSARPAYYSGRGVNRGDLNETHLEMIWQGINHTYGEKAAKAFVKLVCALQDMSATNFLVHLEQLFNRNFLYRKPIENGPTNGAIGATDDAGKQTEAMCFLAAFMTMGSKQSPMFAAIESNNIKLKFLQKHKVKLKQSKQIDVYGDLHGET